MHVQVNLSNLRRDTFIDPRLLEMSNLSGYEIDVLVMATVDIPKCGIGSNLRCTVGVENQNMTHLYSTQLHLGKMLLNQNIK